LEHHDERLKEPDPFHKQLEVLLPKLLTWALALTRNRADAEDLAQGAIVNALAARDTFEPGTNFVGWMYRILRNFFCPSERDSGISMPLTICRMPCWRSGRPRTKS
jgi:RNA polymerase sigma-70 factor (ECF subfamily)